MLIKINVLEPVEQPDGSWKVVDAVHEVDLPASGRTPDMCNWCGKSDYPACKAECEMIRPESKN